MQHRVDRRDFLRRISVVTAASAAFPLSLKNLYAAERLYPPRDLSYFDTPISPASGEIHFGYASITWNGNDRQAIEDIAALGFPGIQLRANVLKEFSGPAELRDLLEKHQLKMVALSSGGVRIDPAVESEEIAKHTANAKFVHDLGGLYLQVTDERPKDRTVTSADYARLGKLLTEIGKRTADLGITLGYHNHMGTLGQSPEEVDQILQAADLRYAKLELDVAHYFQGGGDPAKAIAKYADRLLFLHIKDVESLPAGENSKRPYRFVELGRGRVDLPAVFAALQKVNFRGWAIVELDAVPDKLRTPKDCAEISKKYLEEKLKVMA
ncbi:MAG TPA: sugar phosphate isomerase/epimerase [Candidatus Acidoferrum sp.]|nr:sugar phosphate isomerase/epimerase [Candidatus Acidoferrum sp.]